MAEARQSTLRTPQKTSPAPKKTPDTSSKSEGKLTPSSIELSPRIQNNIIHMPRFRTKAPIIRQKPKPSGLPKITVSQLDQQLQTIPRFANSPKVPRFDQQKSPEEKVQKIRRKIKKPVLTDEMRQKVTRQVGIPSNRARHSI